ncbi:MAG: hypothetical protein LUE98_16900 [Tannerellaceae bacterium]|nr:hypothetical protein [Tannerellaceae bacterium]
MKKVGKMSVKDKMAELDYLTSNEAEEVTGGYWYGTNYSNYGGIGTNCNYSPVGVGGCKIVAYI